LGLSICKNIIEKMGGNVRVESEGIGKGTCFIVQMQGIS
jgi:signal transduction histidine kinase